MALLVAIRINDTPIGLLNIHNIRGDVNGECEYEVTHLSGDPDQQATFTHNRPDGALACIRRALDALEAKDPTDD